MQIYMIHCLDYIINWKSLPFLELIDCPIWTVCILRIVFGARLVGLCGVNV